jgi:hypothetical protein
MRQKKAMSTRGCSQPMTPQSFDDILITPPTGPMMPGNYLRGAGPVWRQFVQQSALRFRCDSSGVLMTRRA